METLDIIIISSPLFAVWITLVDIHVYAKENNYIEEMYMRVTCVGNPFVHKEEWTNLETVVPVLEQEVRLGCHTEI